MAHSVPPHPQYGWDFPEEIPENSGKTQKCSQSVSWNSPWEYGWDAPNPIIQGIWRLQSISRILSPPVRLGTPLFSEVVTLRAGHATPSSTEGISDKTPTRERRVEAQNWKATKEYPNHWGTKIRVFRVCFRAPFLPPFLSHSSPPSFPIQACPLPERGPNPRPK